jgi:dipeptidyl aminopeptidase/acylaminoacyl peptidase
MKKRILIACIASIVVPRGTPQNEITTRHTFSIEEIFAEGGITGSEPTGISWSPNGKGFSFLLREQPLEPTQLWYVDAESGEKRLLASGSELENSVRRPASSRDEREKERIIRYGVASYRWSPDSKHLLFHAGGQLWLYSIQDHSSQPLTFGVLPVEDPQFAPDGKQIAYTRNHNIYTTSLLSHIERRVTREGTSNLLNGEVDSLYAEQLDVRSGFCWSPAGAEIAFLQFDETHVPRYPITDWMPKHPIVDYEKYPRLAIPIRVFAWRWWIHTAAIREFFLLATAMPIFLGSGGFAMGFFGRRFSTANRRISICILSIPFPANGAKCSQKQRPVPG